MEIKAGSEHIRRVLQAAADGRIDELIAAHEVEDHHLEQYRCSSGCTALHWAAGANQVAVVRYLVQERGVNINIAATKKAKGRTPLHYACRNGCLEAVQILVDELGASVDIRAKHSVSPFQLAVWQNHLPICQFLVQEQGVDPAQLNDFDCGAVHWIGLCPSKLADGPYCEGELLLPMAQWLTTLQGIDFTKQQRQGHSALHKAAWGGHVALLRWLRDEIGLSDDSQDFAGNFAADLADMANDERHDKVAQFLRRECSSARAESCAILGVSMESTDDEIRKAYLAKAKQLHPDRLVDESSEGSDFDKARKAYEHLTKESGIGKQSNPAHSLKLMLEVSACGEEKRELEEEDFFRARLTAVLLEYGDKGLDLSNVRRKWNQVWPGTSCPWESEVLAEGQKKRKGVLVDYIRKHASDIVDIKQQDGPTLVILKNVTQSQVAAAAAASATTTQI